MALIIFSTVYPLTTISIGDMESGSGSSSTFPIVPVLTFLFTLGGVLSLRKSYGNIYLIYWHLLYLFLITGVMGYGWYIMEIATLFFVMGLFAGIAMNKSPNNITKLFLSGAADILSAAL